MVDVHAMGRLERWLWRIRWLILGVIALFSIEWGLLGWSDAWGALVGRDTPKNAPYPYFTWPLSVIGWLVLPALIAGVVAYLITSQADRRRRQAITQIQAQGGNPLRNGFTRKLGVGRVPRCERRLDVLAEGPLRRPFVEPFVTLHDQDKEQADRCWREYVNYLLDQSAEAERVPRRHVRSWAEETALAHMWILATRSVPPSCAWCGRKIREAPN
ncbi:DUF6313 family protein [Streptomyces sp. NPDC029216]|uniref:DUF6313 family protein n=1 Tax=Streptomyces sp. NPDC029216 TaxID=3154701 RepID=UPI00340A25D6